jgi:SAM-dependent methyltransferase
MRKLLATLPGVIPLVRIFKNFYYGLRYQFHLGTYSIDGVIHLHKEVEESLAYVTDVFEDYFRFSGIEKQAFEGKYVLEIGPGDSLGVALMMVGLGVRQVVCIDRFLTYRDPNKERAIMAALVDAAPPVAKERMNRCLDSDHRIVGDVIRYMPDVPFETVAEKFGEIRFDYIISRAVLEHVYDIDKTYACCRKLLRSGGRMIHKVDLANHSSVELHPLQFLTYTERLWWLMSSNISRVNRRRCSQHRVALEKNRFAIEKFATTKMLGLSQVQYCAPRNRWAYEVSNGV